MANNGNLTPWVAGQSGNLNGRPVGSRTVFSQGFLKDLAGVWASHGKETMIKTAQATRQPSSANLTEGNRRNAS